MRRSTKLARHRPDKTVGTILGRLGKRRSAQNSSIATLAAHENASSHSTSFGIFDDARIAGNDAVHEHDGIGKLGPVEKVIIFRPIRRGLPGVTCYMIAKIPPGSDPPENPASYHQFPTDER